MSFESCLLIFTVGIILLGVLLFMRRGGYEMVEEMVPVDENDPAIKMIIDQRNDLLNELLEHIALNLDLDNEEVQKTLIVTNIDPDVSTIRFADEDFVCTINAHWDKYMRISFFRNRKIGGETTEHVVRLRVKDNAVSLTKLTKHIVKFRDKAYPEDMYDEKSLVTECIKAAVELAETAKDEDVKNVFLNTVSHFDFANYKHPEDAVGQFVALLTYAMRHHREDFMALLKKDVELENEEEDK